MRTELYYENRINTLTERPKDNGRIVRKLQRELRLLRERKKRDGE
jgi:hypothetical protein